MVQWSARILGLMLGIMAGADGPIRCASTGRIFGSVEQIPARRTGLVPGCAARLASGQMNAFFTHRIAAATQLFHAGKIEYLIVSGDNGRTDYDEASEMKCALVAAGIPEQRIYHYCPVKVFTG
jgi:SanA protein